MQALVQSNSLLQSLAKITQQQINDYSNQDFKKYFVFVVRLVTSGRVKLHDERRQRRLLRNPSHEQRQTLDGCCVALVGIVALVRLVRRHFVGVVVVVVVFVEAFVVDVVIVIVMTRRLVRTAMTGRRRQWLERAQQLIARKIALQTLTMIPVLLRQARYTAAIDQILIPF